MTGFLLSIAEVILAKQSFKAVTFKIFKIQKSVVVNEKKQPESCVDLYFIGNERKKFRISAIYHPYFYIVPNATYSREVMNYLSKRFSETLLSIDTYTKTDLDISNHLGGVKQVAIKLTFLNSDDLNAAKRDLMKIVAQNKSNAEIGRNSMEDSEIKSAKSILIYSKFIEDIREYDIVYYIRFCIDNNVYASKWYDIKFESEATYFFTERKDLVERPVFFLILQN